MRNEEEDRSGRACVVWGSMVLLGDESWVACGFGFGL
jgi:hypothetical protein